MRGALRAFMLLPLLLGACSDDDGGNGQAVDLDAAANRAQGDIDNYAQATPVPDAAPTGRATPPAAPSLPARDTVAEVPLTPGSAQDAANVVQTYFALIEARRYRDAYALWAGDGRAAGLDAAAFAAGFAKYRDYHAEVGAPGPVDAGAGQRTVTVPVRAYGTLADGKPFAMAGPVTLHRVAEGIESDDPHAHDWRISASGLTPRPPAGGG